MQPIKVNLTLPTNWAALSDKQLRYLYQLIADQFNIDEVKTLCFLKWSGLKVIGRQKKGTYLLQKKKSFFELSSLQLAELLHSLDWISSIPTYPVRLARIGRHAAIPADFQGVPFEKLIMADNLYQGYLATQRDDLLDELASVLYGKAMDLRPFERISIFYWMASLKEYFASRYSHFFQPVGSSSDGNLLGSSTSVEEAMNAQIRALTKGDITKEAEILAMDSWRALTELDAQAREYKELNAKIKS